MAYYDVSLLANDQDFYQRSMAAYAVETLQSATAAPPGSWWEQHNWDMAAAPGFADAYASAILNAIPDPGRDPSVITDGQILSAVQAIISQTA